MSEKTENKNDLLILLNLSEKISHYQGDFELVCKIDDMDEVQRTLWRLNIYEEPMDYYTDADMEDYDETRAAFYILKEEMSLVHHDIVQKFKNHLRIKKIISFTD